MRYHCSKCNLAVIVFPGQEPIRACNCNVAIYAEMSANPKGISKVNTNGGIR